MSVALPTASTEEYHIPAPELRGAILELGRCHDIEVGIDGPAGTGKTFGILYYIHLLLLSYPGAKWLITRRYNVDIAGSVMATFQQDILDPVEGITYFGGNRVKPPGFFYPNGSFLAVSGLDRPSRLKSLEVDGIYINEATDCEPIHLEYARTRLRKGVIPWQQIIMDFNPDAPTHWLNERMNSGLTTRLLSRHEDNPRYYDAVKQEWTEEGRRYVLGILEGLTGVRYQRLRLGLWAASEGIIYEEWDAHTHMLSFETLKNWHVFYSNDSLNRQVCTRVIASVDFGFVNPGVIQVWGIIGSDGVMVLLREVYRTQRTIDWWLAQAQALQREFHIETFVCDPSEPAYIQQFNEAGLPAEKAINDVVPGIDAVQRRLHKTNGRPRLFVYEHALQDRDEARAAAHQPLGLAQEINEYVWAKAREGQPLKELPVKLNDHAMDSMRYACMHLDAGTDLDTLDEETAQALSEYRGY